MKKLYFPLRCSCPKRRPLTVLSKTMSIYLLCLLTAGAATDAAADEQKTESAPPVRLEHVPEIENNGALKLDDTSWLVTFIDKNWTAFAYEGTWRDNVFRRLKAEPGKAAFKVTIPGFPEGELRLGLTPDGNGFRYRADVSFAKAAELASLSLETRLPVGKYGGIELKVNGKPLVLPKGKGEMQIYTGRVASLELPGRNGPIALKGDFELHIQDNRAYSQPDYTLRIRFTPGYGAVTDASLELTVECRTHREFPLDLRKAANAGFADEIADDGKGGWTDQGPANDLRMLTPGDQRMDQTLFSVIDPKNNNGKSCIMLAGGARPTFSAAATCDVAEGVSGSRLYLLHATAWPGAAVGSVNVTYRDGSADAFDVRGGREVGNWWAPAACPNGEVVWTAENSTAYVGLYRSRFPLKPKPVKRVEFRSAKQSVWGIIAATVSDWDIPRLEEAPYFIVAGEAWREIPFLKDTVKGSVLDFSDTLDAPAGKYGPLIRRGDKLVFRDRPEEPVRFYGTNLSGTSFYLDKEQADRFADRMAACGFNQIRIHHHDEPLTDTKSTRLQAARMDQLEYLIAAFKQRGIYISTDLYVSRIPDKGEIPEFPDSTLGLGEYKGMFWIMDSVFENWKEYCRTFLRHVNPYTGLALKDDPVLISLNIINEGNIDMAANSSPRVRERYQNAYRLWLEKKGVREPADRRENQRLFSAFLLETYRRRSQQMVEFIRAEGVKCVLADANMLSGSMLSVMRDRYDFVDNHVYWGGPSGTYDVPSSLNQSSALSPLATSPDEIFLTRLYGKPFSVSEFDFCKPNLYRAEGPLLMAAYAGLQGWDMLCQFAYSHWQGDITQDLVTNHFNMGNDCVKFLSNKLGAALFRSGTVRPAPIAAAVVIGRADGLSAGQEYPMALNHLGRVLRVGGVVGDENSDPLKKLPADTVALINTGDNFPADPGKFPVLDARDGHGNFLAKFKALHVAPDDLFNPEDGTLNAANRQIFSNTKKLTFAVLTPSCEAFVLPPGERGRGTFWQVDNQKGRGVFAAVARDGKPLTESGRVLIFHLTDTQAFKSEFSSPAMNLIRRWGQTPHMAAAGTAEISLPAGEGMELYALDTAGKRLARIELPVRDGRAVARLNVFNSFGQTMLYELVRK